MADLSTLHQLWLTWTVLIAMLSRAFYPIVDDDTDSSISWDGLATKMQPGSRSSSCKTKLVKIWSLWRPTRKGTHTNTVTLPDLRKNLLNLIVLIEEGVVSQSHLLPISAGDLLHVYLVSVLALLALWNCFLAYIRLVFPWVHRSYSFWRNLIIHAVTFLTSNDDDVDQSWKYSFPQSFQGSMG